MNNFIIQSNNYLSKNIQAYYHQDYTGYGGEGNPDFINHLKNQFDNEKTQILQNGIDTLVKILLEDLAKIKKIHNNTDFTVCVIPRAKRENTYSHNQKLFKMAVSAVLDEFNTGYSNGTTYITRNKDTKTTHMSKSGYGGEGDMPYVGITKDTCDISINVRGKNILLIDDIYTKSVNIDEDAIQALFDNGANSVIFYAVGKTMLRR